MKTLLLVRHAKSSWKDPTLSDFERPLNKRGKENAPLMGQRLLARGAQPEVVIASPARRARTTAEILAAELCPEGLPVHTRDEIYAADPLTLLEVVRDLDEAWHEVLLVGHNPGLTELANLLAPCALENIVTCGVVWLKFESSCWGEVVPGAGQLLDYDYPKKPFDASSCRRC